MQICNKVTAKVTFSVSFFFFFFVMRTNLCNALVLCPKFQIFYHCHLSVLFCTSVTSWVIINTFLCGQQWPYEYPCIEVRTQLWCKNGAEKARAKISIFLTLPIVTRAAYSSPSEAPVGNTGNVSFFTFTMAWKRFCYVSEVLGLIHKYNNHDILTSLGTLLNHLCSSSRSCTTLC